MMLGNVRDIIWSEGIHRSEIAERDYTQRKVTRKIYTEECVTRRGIG